MKIALLNLPIDLNYGGNIQRYALSLVLRRMGHTVFHIQLLHRARISLPLYKRYFVYLKRIIFSLVGLEHKDVFYEKQISKGYCNVMSFYEKHVPHTEKKFYCEQDLFNYNWDQYDAFVVGSDQVWRPEMTEQIGLSNYLFKFISHLKKSKVAYAVSLGKDSLAIHQTDLLEIVSLYNNFNAVSVREINALDILYNEGMRSPQPEVVLDPTLLLSRSDYEELLKDEDLEVPVREKYVLTYFINKELYDTEVVINFATKKGLKIIDVTMGSAYIVNIPKWVYLFMNADYIFTDSYHGVIFSIIFNKSFMVINNFHGGTSRIESLLNLLGINNLQEIDWDCVNSKIDMYRDKSFKFLRDSLIEQK